jgi:hypothetical protein
MFPSIQRDIDLIRLHGQAFIARIAKAKPSTHIKSQTHIPVNSFHGFAR